MKLAFLPRAVRNQDTVIDTTTKEELATNLGHPSRVVINTIAIFIVSQIVAIFVVGLIYSLVRPGHHPSLDNSIAAQFFYILIAEAVAVGLVIKLVKRRSLGLGVIGLGRWPNKGDLAKAVIGFVIFYGFLLIVGVVINIFSPDLNNQQQNIGFNNISNGTENFLAFISLVILPPLGEETLVRGYLYSGLRKFWRFWPALLVTSVFFGAAHLEFGTCGPLVWAAAIDTFLLSIVLVFLRERTGALYAGMLVHMLNNLIAFGVHFK
jgi:membrane protease YdiL (CAAX protease family)